MVDRPILMSGPMVLAILREIAEPMTGKTMTRQIIKPRSRVRPSLFGGNWSDDYVLDPGNESWRAQDLRFATGDRLWVRETWRAREKYDRKPNAGPHPGSTIIYEADAPHDDDLDVGRLRPSIHMPRWASRLTLDVSAVKVERLTSIRAADVRAEGIEWREGCWGTWNADDTMRCGGSSDPIEAFRCLWINIHGPGTWEANPWVVAITFAPRLGNIDALPIQSAA